MVLLNIFSVDTITMLAVASVTFHVGTISALFELPSTHHSMPHSAALHFARLPTRIHETLLHATCPCVRMLTVVPPPQVWPTDPAHRGAQVMTTVAQAMLQRQVQPTAPPCGIINMPAPPRPRSLALCAQMGLRRACEGGGAAISEGSSSWGASFAQQSQGTTSSLD